MGKSWYLDDWSTSDLLYALGGGKFNKKLEPLPEGVWPIRSGDLATAGDTVMVLPFKGMGLGRADRAGCVWFIHSVDDGIAWFHSAWMRQRYTSADLTTWPIEYCQLFVGPMTEEFYVNCPVGPAGGGRQCQLTLLKR